MTFLKLGNIEIIRIVESETPTNPRFLYPDITPADIEPFHRWLAPRFYCPDAFRFNLNIQAFIVRTLHHTLIVDTCVGNHKNRINPFWNQLQTPFLDRLKDAGVMPEEVDFVMCTHLHIDHVGWNTRLVEGRWEPTFPKARYVFNRDEYEYWSRTGDPEQQNAFHDSVMPVMEAGLAEMVTGEHEITQGVRLMPTPGHTPGHCSVHLDGRGALGGTSAGGAEGVITGDMMHTPLQMLQPELGSSFCVDPAQAAETRRGFLEHHAGRDVRIIGTHFPDPTAGRVVEEGKGFWLEG